MNEHRTPPADPTPIDAFRPPDLLDPPLERLRRLPEEARAFADAVCSSGTVRGFASRSLVTLPYPRKYGLYEACPIPVPYIWFTNRCFIVRWYDDGGVLRTLVAEPTDHQLGDSTPFYADARARVRTVGPWLEERMVTRHATVLDHLTRLGISREEVDWLCFDHLHTQDVRRVVGTTVPVPELGSRDEPLSAWFPNARLILQQTELDHLVHGIHPFQQRFFQPRDRYEHLPPERLHVIDGDVLIAPGVALMRTPGHTLGNQTLVVHAPGRGLLVSSENGIGVESWVPRRSKVAGVRRWAKRWGYEVLMNFNTPEYASLQYNSMVQERLVADTIPGRSDLPQVVPSSELVPHPFAPGIRPGYVHGDLTFGELAATSNA